jgi:hypothetical protein
MRMILENLAPPRGVDQEGSYHVGNEERWRSRSPWRDLHGARKSSAKVT